MADSFGIDQEEEIPFAPQGDLLFKNGLKVFIDKGLAENPEEREGFKHTPVFRAEVTREEIEEKGIKEVMTDFFEARYKKDFGESIEAKELDLIQYLKQNLSIDNVDDPKFYRIGNFIAAFNGFTSGDIGKDILLKSYFQLKHSRHFLFRGAKTGSERYWSKMQANIEAFGTEYNPAEVGSPNDFWAEREEIKESIIATPTNDSPFSVFIAYSADNMRTTGRDFRAAKYSWENNPRVKKEPLPVKTQFVFMMKLK